MADAVILVARDNPDKPLLYACPKCGAVHSPTIYLANKEASHKAAREAAEDCYSCKTHYNCDTCDAETPKGWTRCRSCREAAILAKATEVPDDGGPYCVFDGDEYFFDLEEARVAGCEWVSPCKVHYANIDPDSILENVTADMFEDASVDDLDGVDALIAAVKAFNDAQTVPTYFGDSTRKINVAQAMEARSAETTGSARKGDSAVAKPCAQDPSGSNKHG